VPFSPASANPSPACILINISPPVRSVPPLVIFSVSVSPIEGSLTYEEQNEISNRINFLQCMKGQVSNETAFSYLMSFKASNFAKITAVSDADIPEVNPRYLRLLGTHGTSTTISTELEFDYCIFEFNIGAIIAINEKQKKRFTGRKLRAIKETP